MDQNPVRKPKNEEQRTQTIHSRVQGVVLPRKSGRLSCANSAAHRATERDYKNHRPLNTRKPPVYTLTGCAIPLQVTCVDSQIISSIIIGSCTITATVLGSNTALLVSRKISLRQKLQEDLNQAVRDIHFLMTVEEAHCERNKSRDGESFKLRTRSAVREKSGADFSGRFTPGNCKSND